MGDSSSWTCSLHRPRAIPQCPSSFPGLPEVTTCATRIAAAARASQHARMRPSPFPLHPALRPLMHTLVIAGVVTWLAVALSLHFLGPAHLVLGWGLLLLFLAAFLAEILLRDGRTALRTGLLLIEPALALSLMWLDPRPGTAQVLLVVWITQAVTAWRARHAVLAALFANIAMYAVFHAHGHEAPLVVTLLNVGFQIFAGLCAHYAHSAGQARDRLALVNADLLATRALLAESARDAERLRVARELHDVAGHKLTAMTLNLRALAADPQLAARGEVQVSQQLARELLGDIRGVVQALRDARGLDLGTALRALAAPLPRPVLRLAIDDDVQVADPVVAEAILRLVQEALTNSARHAGAGVVDVHVAGGRGALRLRIEDDGRLRGPLREGNGIAGMRERVAALQGELQLARGERGSLRIDARLPCAREAGS
jgi:signal transduction histidine kinase